MASQLVKNKPVLTQQNSGGSTSKSAKIQFYNFSTWDDVSLCSSKFPPLYTGLFGLTQTAISAKIFQREVLKLAQKLLRFCVFTECEQRLWHRPLTTHPAGY